MTRPSVPLEIERKFLLRRLPPGLRRLRPMAIKQGYLMQSENREVRVRRKGRRWLLTMKEGVGLQRQEVEVELTADQGRALWPLTEGRRIDKKRYPYPWKGHRLEIDLFQGNLAPLRLCEIEFDSLDAAKAFSPPGFLGDEVTEDDDYHNASLAIHGSPTANDSTIQFGAMPFLVKRGRLHLVLVTNRGGSRWILPKGQPEPDMTRPDVALLEAFEEAGVVGSVLPGIRGQCVIANGTTLHLYPMKVATLLKMWPEHAERKRQVLRLEIALKTLGDPELVRCVARLAQRIRL